MRLLLLAVLLQVMAAAAGHPLLRQALQIVVKQARRQPREQRNDSGTTGPDILLQALKQELRLPAAMDAAAAAQATWSDPAFRHKAGALRVCIVLQRGRWGMIGVNSVTGRDEVV